MDTQLELALSFADTDSLKALARQENEAKNRVLRVLSTVLGEVGAVTVPESALRSASGKFMLISEGGGFITISSTTESEGGS